MIPAFVAPEVEWFHLAPVMIVLLTGVLGVLLEAFLPANVRRTVHLSLALPALIAALVFLAFQWVNFNPVDGPTFVVGQSYLLTQTSLFLQMTIVVITILSVVLVADRSSGTEAFAPAAGAVPGSDYEEMVRRRNMIQTEVYPLVMFAAGGMMIFPAAGDLLTMFIALEVLSLPLYVLTGMARHRRLLSQEASLKYFLLGAFASALFLFGIALVYGYTASLNFIDIQYAILENGAGDFQGMGGIMITGLVLMIGGALFKVGAVPFHQWTPDVYQGAPTPITGFMAAGTKVAAFGAILRLVYWTLLRIEPSFQDAFMVALWTVAIATMIVGSVGAIVQHDIKRLLAYSSIAHAGFVLVGLISLDEHGLNATLFYMAAYSLATIGAFAIVQLVRESAVAKDGSGEVILGEATHLSQWAGLGKRNPWLAAAFTLFLLSFAGVPLTGGFIGKYMSFSAAVGSGAWVLALIGVLASAISVFFYIRIAVLMYFVDPPSESPEESFAGTGDELERAPRTNDYGTEAGVGLKVSAAAVRTTSGVTVLRGAIGIRSVIFVTALGTLLLGIVPGPVLDMVSEVAKLLP